MLLYVDCSLNSVAVRVLDGFSRKHKGLSSAKSVFTLAGPPNSGPSSPWFPSPLGVVCWCVSVFVVCLFVDVVCWFVGLFVCLFRFLVCLLVGCMFLWSVGC